MALEIRTAAELSDPELEARWTTRRAARETAVLQQVLRAFVERPGPAEVEQIVAAFADGPSEDIRQDLARLDEDDLIQIRDGLVDVAYPFSAFPTPFVVQLADGQERYACCAIDALGIAPMLAQRVRIRSRCHHCGEPLELGVDPAGSGLEADGAMVWVGKQGDSERRASTSL
jgi:Alkylmercury lyase